MVVHLSQNWLLQSVNCDLHFSSKHLVGHLSRIPKVNLTSFCRQAVEEFKKYTKEEKSISSDIVHMTPKVCQLLSKLSSVARRSFLFLCLNVNLALLLVAAKAYLQLTPHRGLSRMFLSHQALLQIAQFF